MKNTRNYEEALYQTFILIGAIGVYYDISIYT